jgi:hypothetical protein
MVAGDFSSQNSVSDTTAIHLEMVSLEENCPEHEIPRRQHVGIVNPSVGRRETVLPHEEALQLTELSSGT